MRMEVWCLLEPDAGAPAFGKNARMIATEACRLAARLGAIPVGVAINPPDGAATEAGAMGLKRLIAAIYPGEANAEATVLALAEAASQESPAAVLFVDSPLGSEAAGRLGVRMDWGLAGGCLDLMVEGGEIAARVPVAGGKAHVVAAWPAGRTALVTVNPGIMEETIRPGSLSAEEERLVIGSPGSAVAATGCIVLPSDQIDLADAAIVVGIGRGVGSPAEVEPLRKLASHLGAALGGSKPADELGLVHRSQRIGASGQQLTASVYVAVGVSGAAHHLAGIKEVKHVLAINSDKGAPIFGTAEFGIVADWREVVPRLLERLGGEKGWEAS